MIGSSNYFNVDANYEGDTCLHGYFPTFKARGFRESDRDDFHVLAPSFFGYFASDSSASQQRLSGHVPCFLRMAKIHFLPKKDFRYGEISFDMSQDISD